MQMPSLAFAKLSLGPPILITSTTTQLVINIIYFINPIFSRYSSNFLFFLAISRCSCFKKYLLH